ncbi:hypothetical protein ACEQ8H_002743 [Pleosporales sp. CAS-2024a]
MADSLSDTKGGIVEHTVPSPTTSTLEGPTDRAAEKRLLRKLDFRILPVLWILYLVNFVDRANIGNAKIQGMDKELHLIGQRFNIAVWVFNLGYLVAGIPLQIVFKRFGPKSLCVMMMCWGITVIGCGLVKTWQQLVVCRLLEGMAESAFISGAAYLIGSYYTKTEYLTRYVLFLTAGIIAGAINGFLASLIAKMNHLQGHAAWRWIFIIEGCITIFVSICCFPIVPPFPKDCKFLTPEEKTLMLARIQADGNQVSEENITISEALYYLKDWKIWTAVLMNMGVTENANSLSNFQPTILKGLGYTSTQAQVHTIPVYLVGAVFSVVFAYTSEWLHRRYYFYMMGFVVLVVGLAVEIAYPADPKVRYMGMFFIACGCYLAMPISIIWISINCGSGNKRAVALAAIINFGTAGAFVSTNVFMLKEAPKFKTGFSTGLGLAFMGAIAATITWYGCKQANKKREQGQEQASSFEKPFERPSDELPDFRYAL